MSTEAWRGCRQSLESELPGEDFHMWIAPLQAHVHKDILILVSPNQIHAENVESRYMERIRQLVSGPVEIRLERLTDRPADGGRVDHSPPIGGSQTLYHHFTFDNHVEGKSNRIARAAAMQVADNPGQTYNPLFMYGGVGLGKTHLMHATGNMIRQKNQEYRIVYVHSETFVTDMINAIRRHTMEDFKRHYRTIDVLLMDDIQFFAGKNASQEEFFHTFNWLLGRNRQLVITSDRYPKELKGLEDRLISRFDSGLTVEIDPPELETRVAILTDKAREDGLELPNEVAFFIAERIKDNVRSLEGALNRLKASSNFAGRPIDIEMSKIALRDMLEHHFDTIEVEHIQKAVCDYYSIRKSDLISHSRKRSVVRPRQVAMSLSRQLTEKSLPEIGEFFDRDHTTVINACKRIDELKVSDPKLREDISRLERRLAG